MCRINFYKTPVMKRNSKSLIQNFMRHKGKKKCYAICTYSTVLSVKPSNNSGESRRWAWVAQPPFLLGKKGKKHRSKKSQQGKQNKHPFPSPSSRSGSVTE